MNIKKRESQAILQSLSAGVVPRSGMEHFMVGRKQEAAQIEKELLAVKEGASLVKFIIGDFGSGKSFMQAWIRKQAFENKFVIADCDFSPERRLYGGDGVAVATYSELMKNLSTATRPEGNALIVIISKWIEEMMALTRKEEGIDEIDFNDSEFRAKTEIRIEKELRQMENLTGGFDFAKVMSSYFSAYADGDDRKMSSCMRWLRGEYTTRTEARMDLGVRDIIDDTNWYNYVKVISMFVTQVGYAGLIVNFDEAINLYKMTSSQSRDKNYEMILQIFNDSMQGKTEHMYITFAGTSSFLEDERRGLYSYGALRRRLEVNMNQSAQVKDLSQPVMLLYALSKQEAFDICKRVKSIYETHHDLTITMSENEMNTYVGQSYGLLGGEEFTTVGQTLRGFVSLLQLLHQNPEVEASHFLTKEIEMPETKKSVLDRFSTMISNEDKLG